MAFDVADWNDRHSKFSSKLLSVIETDLQTLLLTRSQGESDSLQSGVSSLDAQLI